MKEELQKALARKGMVIEATELTLMFSRPTPMHKEDYSMWHPHLLTVLREYVHNKFGKDLDRGLAEESAKTINKAFPKLSTSEVRHCCQRIINGFDDIQNTYVFNVSDLIKAIKQYEGRKKYAVATYFDVKRAEQSGEEAKELADTFLRASLEKMRNKKHLTVYERSTLGKHFADQMEAETLESAMNEAREQLPTMVRTLTAKRKSGLESFLNDQAMDVPVAWTESLLYGVLLFNQIKQ